MYMSDEEIRISYKTAKNQKRQVFILAQLNLCKPEDIVRVLGISDKIIKKRHYHKWTTEDDNLILKMHRSGYDDHAIAEQLHIDAVRIHKHLHYLKQKESHLEKERTMLERSAKGT